MFTRNNHKSAICLLVATLFGLSACQTNVLSGSDESERAQVKYEGKAKRVNRLEIPPNLTSVDTTFGVELPDVSIDDTTVDTGNNNLLAQPSNVEIKRDGQIRWLVVKEPVSDVWPRIISFWDKDGVPLVTANPATGVVETDWLINYADFTSKFERIFQGLLNSITESGQRDKYRMRVDNGVEPGTTDIYLTHLGVEEVEIKERGQKEINDYEWQARNSDPNLEAEVLRLLMVHLGVDAQRADDLAYQNGLGAGAEVARLVDNEEEPVLLLNYDADSSWRRVGAALDRMDVVINGYNRQEGVYGITATQKVATNAGFLKRLFTKTKKEKEVETVSQVRIIPQEDGITVVAIATEDGVHDSSEYALDLLNQLYLLLK